MSTDESRPAYPHGDPPKSFPGAEHEEGMDAYEGGLDIEANPYKPGSPEHYAWWLGWLDMQEDCELEDDFDDDDDSEG